MMAKNKLNPFILFILLLIGCTGNNKNININNPQIRDIINYNIVIAPDLSNRVLVTKPLTDSCIVGLVLSKIPQILHSNGREMYQKDKFSIQFINQRWINNYQVHTNDLSIDIGNFSDQRKRIIYIQEGELKKAEDRFMKEYGRLNYLAKKNNSGADVWTYLNTGIDNSVVLSRDNSIGNLNQTYKNTLIILTDGYIEAGLYGTGYDLSGSKIRRIRNSFLRSGMDNFQEFFNAHPEFHIKKVNNPLLKNLDILVLELYDRSLHSTGEARTHPTDAEIMQVAWQEWFKSSGVKHFEFHQTFGSKAEADKVILNFLGVKNNN